MYTGVCLARAKLGCFAYYQPPIMAWDCCWYVPSLLTTVLTNCGIPIFEHVLLYSWKEYNVAWQASVKLGGLDSDRGWI